MKINKIKSQYMNYLNIIKNMSRRNFVYFKRNPINNNNKSYYGEKIKEKNNYILYASGNNQSYYECSPDEMRFKVLDNSFNNNISLIYNKTNDNFYNHNINHIISKKSQERKILKSADNYAYKETKNIKNFNPNIKTITKHDMDINETPPSPPRYNYKNTNKKTNTRINCRNRNRFNNKENNQKIKILQDNKSCDVIIRRSKYQYKINNEYSPDNHKSLIVKVTKNKKGNLKEIYQKKFVKKDPYENEPFYVANFGEDTEDSYETKNMINIYYDNNNYSNSYKNIQCPIHGDISIFVHKKKRPSHLYKKYK